MTRELIEDFTKIVKPFVQKRLLEENFEGMGEQDKAEFGRDFDEILSLAIKGLEISTWIPVTERLPQESRMFLVTLVDKEDDYVCIDVVWYAHPNDYSIEFGEWREVPTGEKVIAWMQLPEPYKGE